MRIVQLGVVVVLVLASVVWAGPFDPVISPSQGPEARARKFLEDGQPKMAIDVLTRALETQAKDSRLRFVLGQAYMQDGKADMAKATFQSLLKDEPDFVEARVLLAMLYVGEVAPDRAKADNLKSVESAIKEYKAAIDVTPHNTRLYFDVANLQVQTTQYREGATAEAGFADAIRTYEDLRKRIPDDVGPVIAIGDIRLQNANFVAGGKRLSELDPEKKKRCNDLLDAAMADFREALRVQPRALLALGRLADVQNARDDQKGAIKTLEDHAAKLDNPQEKALCFRWMGQYLIGSRDYGPAEEKLNLAIKTEPRELMSYLLLSQVQRERNQPEQAMDTLKKALTIEPNFLNAHIELGQLLLSQQKPEEAAENFKAALNIAPGQARIESLIIQPREIVRANLYSFAAAQLGEIMMQQNKFDDARIVFRRLATLTPESPLPEFYIGETFRRSGEPDKAKEHYENALRRNRNFVQARRTLGEMELADLRFATDERDRKAILERALDHLQMARENAPDDPTLHDRLAELRIMLAYTSQPKNRAALEQALTHAKRAVELRPEEPAFRFRLAFVQRELGNNKDAMTELDKLIADATKAVADNPDAVENIFRLADLRRTQNSWQRDKATLKQALDGYESVIKKRPDFLEAYVRAAVMLEIDEKDYVAAVDWFKRLFDAAKGESSLAALSGDRHRHALHASAELAWIYCEHLNDLKKAEEYAKLASDLDPTHPALLDTIGWIHYKNKEYGKAINYLRQAQRSAPNNATIGYHLGAALVKDNNLPRAKEALEDALKKAGDDAELKQKIQAELKAAGG